MGAGITQLVELAEQDRKFIASLPVLDERDEIELRVIRCNGDVQIARLPPRVAGMIRTLLDSLSREERVVILSKGPNRAY